MKPEWLSKLTETELESLVSMLVNSRTTALSEMARGIVHEVNSPLTVIQLHADSIHENIQKVPAESAVILKSSSKILGMVERISKLLTSVRALSLSWTHEDLVDVEVTKILDQVLEVTLARFKQNSLDLKIDSPPVGLQLQCRPVQISHVLLNLLNNSFDAVKDLPERWVKLEVQDRGNCVQFSVTDSGKGITEGIRKQIFKPFFTTKIGDQDGAGLGLTLAQSIVQGHQGTLELDEASPQTRFVFMIPKS